MTGGLFGSGLSAHGVAALIFATIVFALFIWDRLPITTVCLVILVALPFGFVIAPLQTPQGPVDPMRFYAGFGHPALIAICGLMIVGHGLVVTGALEPAARRLSGLFGSSPWLALLAVLVGACAVSGLVNDTPVVVLLIPLILAAAARAKVSAGTMLLPMNYAVLIGGMSTTIGTSTNLIVVALAAALGVGPFGLFDFYPIVAAAAVPALLYLWLVAPRLLSHVHPPVEELSEQVFDAEIWVDEGGWLDGRPLREALSATGGQLHLVELRRGGRALARLPSVSLRAGDRLLVQDTAANLKDFETSLHAALHGVDTEGENEAKEEADRADKAEGAGKAEKPEKAAKAEKADEEEKAPKSAVVAQMIVTPTSPLVMRSVRQERIAERYGTIVVGLRPHQQYEGFQRENLTERRISAGDILLLQGEGDAIRQVQRDGFGLLLDERYTLPRQDKAGIALLAMAAVVVLAATKTLPISLAALGGVLLLLATRCLSWQDVTHSLSVKVVLLVAASLALGDALDLTGATAWMARQLADVASGLSPGWVLALLMALMGLLTNFVSNNAAAAIGTPLGVELARSLGVPPESFVLAVLFGCNLCYLTPMGYQTNLLVMNAGGYRFADFVRVGTPLFLIMWAGLSYGLVLRYAL
ncbi:MAG: SLC13 family permease [Burkholderiales bacterium]